jgi:hypothetical protein
MVDLEAEAGSPRRWSSWAWREEPEAPLGWAEPERQVVLVDGMLGACRGPGHPFLAPAGALRSTALREASAVLREAVVVYVEEPTAYPHPAEPFGARGIPGVVLDRQAGTGSVDSALGPLCRVSAEHRALVVTPREPIEIGLLGIMPKVWGLGYTPVYARIDLVIVRGPTGPDAWPMHPKWVRAVRDECAFAGVAFAFLGWGEWAPTEAIDSPTVRGTPPMAFGSFDALGLWHEASAGNPGDPILWRCGAERSGRLLDGVEHLALPEGL